MWNEVLRDGSENEVVRDGFDNEVVRDHSQCQRFVVHPDALSFLINRLVLQ